MQGSNRNYEASFNKLYKEYKTKVSRYIASKVRNKEVAEELTQDVFVKIATHLHSFDEKKSAFTTWVYNIAKNILIDHFRKAKMQLVSIETPDMNYDTNSSTNVMFDPIPLEDSTRNPLEQMIVDESTNSLKEAIKQLPKSERKLITLYAIKSQTYEEIAAQLDMPMGTVKGTIHRARLSLKRSLEPALAL